MEKVETEKAKKARKTEEEAEKKKEDEDEERHRFWDDVVTRYARKNKIPKEQVKWSLELQKMANDISEYRYNEYT